jgi:hypothetical protein
MFETTYTPIKRFIKIGNHLFDADDILVVESELGSEPDEYKFVVHTRSLHRFEFVADLWDIRDVAESLEDVGIQVGYPEV